VLIELGGNDLLNRASATEFGNDLGKLLMALERPGRALVMFELPLLPGQFLMGRSQRSAARAHACYLIPKRFFASVFAGPEATIDGLHLSENGSRAMAQLVQDKVGTLLAE
jgi:lysophospholipase L1-like esterase